jgi:hypothetical protein
VAEVLPLSEGELRLLESLIRHQVRFMVVGLSAAALQGAPVVTEDVDLWFEDLNDPKLFRALRKVGAAYVPPFGHNPPMLAGSHTEPFDVVISMSGLRRFAYEFKGAVEIRVGRLLLKVLPLGRILESKAVADRPKDRLVIPVLRNTISTLRTMQSPRPEKPKAARQRAKRKERKRA